MSNEVEDMEYEKDVLKFKQIWKDIKTQPGKPTKDTKPQEGIEEAGRTTIKPASRKKSGKKTVVSQAVVEKSTRPNPNQVIQVVTQPKAILHSDRSHKKANQSEQVLAITTNPLNTDPNQLQQDSPQQLMLSAGEGSSVGTILQLKKALQGCHKEMSFLRVLNTRNLDKIAQLEKEINQKDDKIQQLKSREAQLVGEKTSLISKEVNFNYGKVEYQNFKNDSKRLLKMLQSTQEYQTFAKLAVDDGGVRFLNQANQKHKGKLDVNPSAPMIHFCTCNKEFIPESTFWVPEGVYSFGKEFIKERKGDLSPSQFELLLYEMNKLWREREKRIINTMKSSNAFEVDRFKRKINNMRLDNTKRPGDDQE